MSNVINLFTKQVVLTERDLPQGPAIAQPLTGYAAVKERIEARFGNKLPKHFKKLMSKPQAQPYEDGDTFNVVYKRLGNVEQKTFNAPMPVPCEVTLDSCRKVDDIYLLGADCERGADEAFQWMDITYQVTLNFLKSLPNGAKLKIITRSDLVACTDYVDELKRLNVSVRILYNSTDEEKNRRNEPGAPSYKRREAAVQVLKEHGIKARLLRHSIPKSKGEVA